MFAEKLKEKRKEKGISQVEMSEKLGIGQSHFCRLENGKHSPSVELLVKIADVLECTVDELVR